MKRSNSRVSDTWKQFTVKAIHDGKEVVASGFASWKYDAIGLFLSENPDICTGKERAAWDASEKDGFSWYI